MAEMFLWIDGIQGESTDSERPKWIEIQSWTWNTHNQIRWDMNQGGQSTKAKIDGITVTKICDQASVTLHRYCLTGKHFKNARIICRKNDGEKKLEYLTVEMTDVMISKVHWDGSGDAQAVGETVDISFADFTLKYKTQRDSGHADGEAHFRYNIQTQET
jgi:type VI secretion system secreted protein Hcp